MKIKNFPKEIFRIQFNQSFESLDYNKKKKL